MNNIYEYFISFMYVDALGATRLKNCSVTRENPIVSFEDLKDIQEALNNKLQTSDTAIISYQLLSINKEAYL